MATPKRAQNLLPLSPDPVPVPQSKLECSEIVVSVDHDGVTIEAEIDAVDQLPGSRIMSMKLDVFLEAVPATTMVGLEAWLLDLLRRTFAPKDDRPAA